MKKLALEFIPADKIVPRAAVPAFDLEAELVSGKPAKADILRTQICSCQGAPKRLLLGLVVLHRHR